ncbi:MAG: hypothetical protein M3548_05900 [Actinomycetota bacterium]|nr:hypothetical protein [Actinomycetota bacterium]
MKTSLFTAGAVLALLALTACGQSTDQAESPVSTQPTTTVVPTTTESAPPTTASPSVVPAPPTGEPTTPSGPQVTIAPSGVVVPPGYQEVPVTQVDAKALPDGYSERRVWVSGDGKTVQAFAIAPDSCTMVEGHVTGSDDGMVKIALNAMAQRQGGPEQVCATVITPRPVTVTLKQPLEARTVVLVEGP